MKSSDLTIRVRSKPRVVLIEMDYNQLYDIINALEKSGDSLIQEELVDLRDAAKRAALNAMY